MGEKEKKGGGGKERVHFLPSLPPQKVLFPLLPTLSLFTVERERAGFFFFFFPERERERERNGEKGGHACSPAESSDAKMPTWSRGKITRGFNIPTY